MKTGRHSTRSALWAQRQTKGRRSAERHTTSVVGAARASHLVCTILPAKPLCGFADGGSQIRKRGARRTTTVLPQEFHSFTGAACPFGIEERTTPDVEEPGKEVPRDGAHACQRRMAFGRVGMRAGKLLAVHPFRRGMLGNLGGTAWDRRAPTASTGATQSIPASAHWRLHGRILS